jgi:hypothetical protein
MIGYDIDSAGNQVNYGNNVLLSYETRPDEYNNETGQGLETTLIIGEMRLWYLLNPASNLVIEGGARLRRSDNEAKVHQTAFVYFGIRTNLSNRYFDF